MRSAQRYTELVVSGGPRELGRQIGEGARDLVRGFCEVAMQQVNRTLRISRASAMAVAEVSIKLAEGYSPDMVDELRGTAEAAGVSLADLMLLQVRNQLQADEGGCTSFSLASVEGLGRVVAQNWDNDPFLDPFTLVLTRHPTGKPALTTVTQAGLIAYIGFNSEGIGICLNTLPAPSRKFGVPHYFTARGILEADSLDGAVTAVSRAERVIPANIMMTTPQGPANLEVTIDNVYVLRDAGDGIVTHTNHARHPELAAVSSGYPELIQSRPRLARIDQLLEKPAESEWSFEQLQSALCDHENHPQSICRHPNSIPPHGFWETVFSVIIAPEAREMYLTRGTPCDHPFERYRME
ncbi:MAG: Peptidase [Planctomycetaceae bacterium]|nr:Peptidase [Planctomycetaceae bacterium]